MKETLRKLFAHKMEIVDANKAQKMREFNVRARDVGICVIAVIFSSFSLLLGLLLILGWFWGRWNWIKMWRNAELQYFSKEMNQLFGLIREPKGWYWVAPKYAFVLARAKVSKK